MNEDKYFAGQYREEDIRTATPLHLIVMLYEGALRSLEEARDHMKREDIAGWSQSINRCGAIISELQSALNMKDGGDIASSLNRTYDYMKPILFRAEAERNPELLAEVSEILEKLHSVWRQTWLTDEEKMKK